MVAVIVCSPIVPGDHFLAARTARKIFVGTQNQLRENPGHRKPRAPEYHSAMANRHQNQIHFLYTFDQGVQHQWDLGVHAL